MKRWRDVFLVVILGGVQVHAQSLSFVTCPIVRDTQTIPCWLAEYRGETYYLGIQGGVAQDFYPPQLNHEVLVEGVIAEGPRVCGGVPLHPVKTSVLLEINRNCNTILPAEDGIDAPQRPPARDPVSWVRSDGPEETTLFFDFDNDFLSLHTTTAVQRVVDYFLKARASRIEVTAFRGSSKLSNGNVMVELSGIAAARAKKVREILEGLGVPSGSECPPGQRSPRAQRRRRSMEPQSQPVGQAVTPPRAGVSAARIRCAPAQGARLYRLSSPGQRQFRE